MRKSIKRFIQTVLKKMNLKLVRIVPAGLGSKHKIVPAGLRSKHKLSAYEAAVLALLSKSPTLRIAVVGANDGKYNDPIYTLVHDFISTRTQMVLIEPQQRLHGYLAAHYDFHGDVHILGCAIGPDETLELHAIRPEFWARSQPNYAEGKGWPEYHAPTGITSTDRRKVVAWAQQHVKDLNNSETAVETFKVSSQSLPAALAEAGLDSSIDVLQVDAEGFDDIVIFNADLAQTRPQIIYFEWKHLPPDRLAKLIAHLDSLGYVSTHNDEDILAIHIDEKSRIQTH